MPNKSTVIVRIVAGSVPATVDAALKTAMAIALDRKAIRILCKAELASLIPPADAGGAWTVVPGPLTDLLKDPGTEGRCVYMETALQLPAQSLRFLLEEKAPLTVARATCGTGANHGGVLATIQARIGVKTGLNRQICAEPSFFSVDMAFLREKGIELPADTPEGAEGTFLAAYVADKQGRVNAVPRQMLGFPPDSPVTTTITRTPPAAPANVARPAVPVPASDIKWLWDNQAAFAKVFPELVGTYNDMKARYSAAGCANCVKNSLTTRLAAALDGIADNRDLTPLGTLGTELSKRWAAKRSLPAAAKAPADGWSERGPRPTCLNCVRKHIGQAIVLLGESLLGYPAHRWIAVGHLGEASEECVEKHPELAMKIREIRNRMTDDLTNMPNLLDLFDLVDTHEKRK